MKPWYEELFENYSETYDRESFTQGTQGEVDFIERELGNDRAKRILDIGCGTGRHAIELSRRGYRVTGIDLSSSQIAGAIKKAEIAGVSVDFLVADARQTGFFDAFDATLLICEAAFPLMETDEMNYRILAQAVRALKPGGKLILTTLSALYPLCHSVKEMLNSDSGDLRTEGEKFDLLTFRMHSIVRIRDDSGTEKKIACSERYYSPAEIHWLLSTLGLTKVDIHGCRLGKFSRDHALTPDDFEMLVIAEK